MKAKTEFETVSRNEVCYSIRAQHHSPTPKLLTIRRGNTRAGKLVYTCIVSREYPSLHSFYRIPIVGPVVVRLHRCQSGYIKLAVSNKKENMCR